jgi:dephospho-CoA kinase
MGDQAKHPIIIGLTGNIGSGKSTVAAFLREMGYPVLDADLLAERARELKKAELKALFPEAFLGEELDRRRLAQLVFSDPQKLRALEELIHPEVRRLLEEELSRLKRAMARSGLSREEVLARERAQMPEEEKRRRATWVLENRGSLEDLRAQVQALLGEIRAILGA